MTYVSEGANFLLEIKSRLESIRTTANYPLSVNKVVVASGILNLDIPASQLPCIEITQGREQYTPQLHGKLEVESFLILRLVNLAKATDMDMEEFKASVIRCMYANSWNAQTNDATRFNNTVNWIRLEHCETDQGLIESNRVWYVVFSVHRHTTTYGY
jgi:hypothetical protein